jgi:hypothetical protein
MARRLVRVGAVPEQQLECRKVVEVEHAVERVGSRDAGPVLQQEAGARGILQRVVERLAVIRIGARVEQQLGELRS